MYTGMTFEQGEQPQAASAVADFRSDTVTRPTDDMRRAMAAADVGDDVYGEDPGLKMLEERLSELTGKSAALFFPSGTQSNLAALLTHCGRGDEYITGDCYHIFCDEAGGAAVLGGISPFPLVTDAHGGLCPEQVKTAIKADDPHYPVSRLLCLENTVSGKVQSIADVTEVAETARRRGLSVHLDGARAFNAATALGVSLSEVCAPADSVSICLSKGLGAPVGSVLCGAEDFIRRAGRMRKLLGGAMRQAGVLAACGLYALDHHVERLGEDHERARRLAEGLATIDRVSVDPDAVETNMVFMDPGQGHHAPLQGYLARYGVLIGGQQPEIRLVTHLDVDDEAVDLLVQRTREYFQN